MKVSPMASATNSVQSSDNHNQIRNVRVQTQQTPAQAQSPIPENLSTSDTGEAANASAVTQPLDPQLAVIARHRRALQVKERELKAREEALKNQPAQGSVIDVARLKEQPLSVLLENGVTYDQLTQAVMAAQNGVSPAELYALKQQLKDLKEGMDKSLTERDAQAGKVRFQAEKHEAQLLSAQGEEFELVRETGSVPLVMDLIARVRKEGGEITVREAMDLMEKELLADILKVTASNKVKSQLPQAALPQAQSARPATLTNRDQAQVPMTAKQRAIAAFWGQPIKR